MWRDETETKAGKCLPWNHRTPDPATQAMLEVCVDLDAYQARYAKASWDPDGMPGNDLYSGLLMVIVRKARAAIAAVKGDTNADHR
jgi:hypothetical protein